MSDESFITLCAGIMDDAEAVVLTTVGSDGYPHSRALLNLRNRAAYPSLGDFYDNEANRLGVWFTTNTSSAKIAEIRENGKAAAYYTVPREFRGVMLAGDLEIIEDPAITHFFWQENWTMYYPKGKDDPDYSIVRLHPRRVKGWAGFKPFLFTVS